MDDPDNPDVPETPDANSVNFRRMRKTAVLSSSISFMAKATTRTWVQNATVPNITTDFGVVWYSVRRANTKIGSRTFGI